MKDIWPPGVSTTDNFVSYWPPVWFRRSSLEVLFGPEKEPFTVIVKLVPVYPLAHQSQCLATWWAHQKFRHFVSINLSDGNPACRRRSQSRRLNWDRHKHGNGPLVIYDFLLDMNLTFVKCTHKQSRCSLHTGLCKMPFLLSVDLEQLGYLTVQNGVVLHGSWRLTCYYALQWLIFTNLRLPLNNTLFQMNIL